MKFQNLLKNYKSDIIWTISWCFCACFLKGKKFTQKSCNLSLKTNKLYYNVADDWILNPLKSICCGV